MRLISCSALRVLSVVCLFLLCVSCATRDYGKIDRAATNANYKDATDILESNKKSIYGSDAVLYFLDKGLLLHYGADYDGSRALLEKGDRAIEAAFTKSITANAASFLLNDNTKEYAGEDYENIYLNVFNALNYYHLGDLENAMVEIRRMEEKLASLATRYKAVDKELNERDKNVARESNNAKLNFSNSALSRYLGMLFFRANGSYDDARIDRDALKRVFSDEKAVYPFAIPSSIDSELNIPNDKARLNVLCFSGLSPIKDEEVDRVPTLNMQNWIKIALPYMSKRQSSVHNIEIVFSDGKTYNLELLEDIQNVALETFKKHLGIIKAKSIMRATAKGVTASGFTSVGDSSNNVWISLAGIILQIFAEASESADLRTSRYFPAKAYTAGITLPSGVYNFSIKYYNNNGSLITSFDFKDFNVQNGALNLVETFCLK